MKLLVSDIDHNKNEFYEAQRNTIGPRDMAIIAGGSDYQSILELYGRKKNKIPSAPSSDAAWYSRQQKPIISGLFARKESSLEVKKASALFVHSDIEWASAAPDYWVLDRSTPDALTGVLDCRDASARSMSQWQDGIPARVLVELYWTMGVLGVEWSYIAAVLGGTASDLKFEKIEFDKQIFPVLVDQAAAFMEHVTKGVEPPVTRASDKRIIEFLRPERRRGAAMGLPQEAYPIVKRYMECSAKRKELDKESKALKAQEEVCQAKIVQLMGEYEIAETDWGVRFKAHKTVVKPFMNPGNTHTTFTPKGDFMPDPLLEGADLDDDFDNSFGEDENE